jgi:hypothetical protein
VTARRLGPAVVLCLAAAVACGGAAGPPPLAPELTLGAAPTDLRPVPLPAYPPGSVGDGPEWPRACDLLTDDDVLAVLPQATGVAHTGDGDTIDYDLTAIPGTETEPAADPHGRARRIEVPERSCTVTALLPAVDDDGGTGIAQGSVDVRITMVGSPDTVGFFWSPFQPQPMADRFGADECVQEFPDHRPDPGIGTFDCRRGELSFSLTTGFSVLDGQHVRLPGQPANSDPAVAGQWFREQVGPALVGVVVRRMP